ncbi:MAG TPA: hypothetical protein GXX75_24020 [Clostridiales bacterium]|nr:hypothetical protein [Clostridiales bacterium]
MGVTTIQRSGADPRSTDTVKAGGNAEEKAKLKQGAKENGGNSDTIQASDLNLAGSQDTELKRLLGQKAALQIQLKQFEKELELDDVVQGYADKRESLLEEAGENQNEVKRLSGLKAELKESLGIDDDSQEQKDLLIREGLQKKQMSGQMLTDEERELLRNMEPMTQYQEASLEYSRMIHTYQKRAEEAVEGSIRANQTISAIKQERLKSDPMAKANKEAADLLKEVDDEIKKALAQEVADRVKENLGVDEEELLLSNPQALVEKKKATEEDLKGLAVDERL